MRIVILAGGSGTRLWPLSRIEHPKQFLHFGQEHSLLQKTVLRFLRRFDPSQILIVAGKEVIDLVRMQIIPLAPALEEMIALEPCPKGTAPAIAWAFKWLEEKQGLTPQEPVLISPSDHWISPEELFLEKIEQTADAAKQGKIVVFGIRPSRPETGYGYIQPVHGIGDGLQSVKSFIEKPDLSKATQYVLSQEYLWNMGTFLLTSQTFWQEASLYMQTIGAHQFDVLIEMERQFSKLAPISFDYAIMEKTKKAMVMPLDVAWSDVGSWDSLYEVMAKDEQSNAVIGNVQAIDTTHSLIIGGKRLVSTIGLEGMLVVDTEDAIFIAKRGESQKVRNLVEMAKAKCEKPC
jgi:mannose-1-phosphate guanylyltransferase / mannose-6-phosphate isomerase